MGHGTFVKTFLLAIGMVVALWSGVEWLGAQKRTAEGKPFAGEHAEEKLTPARPDRQASELTNEVAAKLPHTGSRRQPVVRRNLIDEHLFGAMAKDHIPHAPLSNDYEFCRRLYLDLTGRIPTPEQLEAFVRS